MLFWGCFIALITTSTAFITRAILVNTVWPVEFGLDKVQAQELFGAGIWPFAISIMVAAKILTPTTVAVLPRWTADTIMQGAAATAARKAIPWLTLFAISSPGDWTRALAAAGLISYR